MSYSRQRLCRKGLPDGVEQMPRRRDVRSHTYYVPMLTLMISTTGLPAVSVQPGPLWSTLKRPGGVWAKQPPQREVSAILVGVRRPDSVYVGVRRCPDVHAVPCWLNTANTINTATSVANTATAVADKDWTCYNSFICSLSGQVTYNGL